MDTVKNICVFGASSNAIDEKFKKDAFETGRLIALAGCGLVFGAGDSGLMGQAARGAASEGGRVIGVIPEKLNKKGVYFEGCTERIETPTMHERKAKMESMSSGFIALGGGFGTIEELMEVMTLKQLSYIDAAIVLLNTGGYFDPLIEQFSRCIEEGFVHEGYSKLWFVASTPEVAVDYCVNYKGTDIPDKLIFALRG
jgi:uncharacterized protein (TIGR00730 family)